VNLVPKNRLALLLALVALIPLSACGGDGSSGPGGQRNAPDSIAVLADSSLKKAFTRMGNQFETQNPGSTVTFTYGASTSLAQQASAGDPGDTLTTNSKEAMNKGTAVYQIVTLNQSRNTTLSQRFIDLVTSPTGQSILQRAGFGTP
jgi:ABC-type molybdate transport system substrate-binding protein